MSKRAVSIARVSTDDQADKGFSLAAQLAANRKYAELHGFDVIGEFVDDGVSGAIPFGERPAGARALALLRSGGAEVLLVQNVDRLSRDIVDLLVTIRSLLQAGIEIHTGDLGRVTSEIDIMLVIRGWQGSDEREKIKARTMRGKREKLTQGMVVGGRLPYGYNHLRDEKKRIVNFEINEEQAAVVRLIFQWYTVGDEDGGPYSLYTVQKRLVDAGIPTGSKARGKAGAAYWGLSSVKRLLDNPIYKGEWHYHAADGEQFTIAIPPIVDAATWGAAQEQKRRNSRKAKRNAKRDYLLTGIIKCGCGYSMVGERVGKYYYYRCLSKGGAAGKCGAYRIRADALEAAVWDALLKRLENSDTLEADLREAQRKEEAAQEPQRAELETVIAMMREAEKDATTLADSLNALGDKRKGLVSKTLQDRINAVDERYNALAQRRDELEAALSKRRYTDEAIQRDLDFAADRRAGLADADHATKRAILDQFNARVIVTDGKARLCYTMPEETSIDLHLSWRLAIPSAWNRP